MVARDELLRALYSLKEDASFAWKEALEGNFEPIFKVGLAWKVVEATLMRLDRGE